MEDRTERAREFRRLIDSAGMMLSDAQALECKELYRQWDTLIGVTITEEDVTDNSTEEVFKFLYWDDLYKFIGALPHTFAAEWVPGVGTESLYARIDESHAGTIDDPIPYSGNMELREGLYYTEDGVVYYCFRNTDIPVYSPLSELVGLYVNIVEDENKTYSGLLEDNE